VRVDQVRVEGVTVYDQATIERLYADLIGATVARWRLGTVVEALQARYRADGYILTVVRGQTEIVNGRTVFVLRAIEGYVGSVELDGDTGPAGTLVYGFLDHLTSIPPVKNADLERYLPLAQDVPGVTVRAVLRRIGNEPGPSSSSRSCRAKPSAHFTSMTIVARPRLDRAKCSPPVCQSRTQQPKRRRRCWKERIARRKSILRKAGHKTSVK